MRITESTNRTRIALPLLLSVVHLTLPASASERVDPRLTGRLASRNQAVQSQTLAVLEANRAEARRSIAELAAAAATLSQRANETDLVDPSTVRLIRLIGSIDHPVAEQSLIELLDCPHAPIAMIAAQSLGEHKRHAAIDYLKKQTSRPEYQSNYGFRFNLIRALVQMDHPDAIEFVTGQAGRLDGQLRHRCDQVLVNVTIDHFGGDQQRFDQWSQSWRRTSFFPSDSQQSESLNRLQLSKQQYYGIDIHAKRLMFIIDRSGSMKEYDRGQTRLARAKAELTQTIEGLPADTEFALVFFDDKIKVWKEELVPASEENKRRAVYAVQRLRDGESTDTYAALRKALDFDESLEAVFLLTDGRPTAGDLIVPGEIVRDILHRNRFKNLNFNTIGIAVSGPTENFLRTLAEQSDGEFRIAE